MENDHVSLREFVERIIDEREKKHRVELDALEKATELAFKNVDTRMSHLNALREDYSRFITNDKYEVQHEGLRKQVDLLISGQARWIGIATAISFISGIIGGIIVKLFGL